MPGGLEADFAGRVTAERRAAGLGALATEDDLVAVARKHSADMASAGRLDHNALLGQQVQGWLVVAENVGVGSSVDQVHGAMMASAPHRADILDNRFTGIGVGVVQSGATLWVTEVFRRSAGAASSPPARKPAAPPAPAPAAPAGPAPAPPPGAARQARTDAVTTSSTTTTLPTTTTTTTPVTAAPSTAGLAIDTLAASSLPVEPRSGLVATGLLAALLLWAVAAGVVKVAVRNHLDAGRRGRGGSEEAGHLRDLERAFHVRVHEAEVLVGAGLGDGQRVHDLAPREGCPAAVISLAVPGAGIDRQPGWIAGVGAR